MPEYFGGQVSAPGAVDDRGDRTTEGVRSDALDAGLGKGHSQAATDVVREQWRVVMAEEDQMLGSSEAAQGAAQSRADFEAAIVHRPDGCAGPIGTWRVPRRLPPCSGLRVPHKTVGDSGEPGVGELDHDAEDGLELFG